MRMELKKAIFEDYLDSLPLHAFALHSYVESSRLGKGLFRFSGQQVWTLHSSPKGMTASLTQLIPEPAPQIL